MWNTTRYDNGIYHTIFCSLSWQLCVTLLPYEYQKLHMELCDDTQMLMIQSGRINFDDFLIMNNYFGENNSREIKYSWF